MLDSLLTGPTSLNMFGGGGVSNKTSRLYRALVERELAVGLSGGLQATIDPFLYDTTITVRTGQPPRKFWPSTTMSCTACRTSPAPAEEIARAIKQARALFAYGSENITNQAFWLGYAEMFARYAWFTGYLEHLAAVTPQDVQRVAQTYLADSRLIQASTFPTAARRWNERPTPGHL